jgi:hypothetical protein
VAAVTTPGAPPSKPAVVTNTVGDLKVIAYRGVGAAMLAFDLPKAAASDLAGFAVDRTDPLGTTRPLLNRLSFVNPLTSTGGPPRHWTDSHLAPFQYFRWIDVPPDVVHGDYTYTVTARHFTGNGTQLRDGESASVTLPLLVDDWKNFQLGFTRGYLSSQAYVDHFHDAQGNALDFRPRPITLDYDTTPYQPQYVWLGFTGRRILFDFMDEIEADPNCKVDMFAYDFDEPDLLTRLEALGDRLRAFLDDADLHTDPKALEPEVKKRLQKSAGENNVRTGHFTRFSHCKVLIKKDASGKALSVLAGSANFSVRGLYAQANNIFVFRDEEVADLYEKAFNQAFDDPHHFRSSDIAKDWHEVSEPDIPAAAFCFSPHKDGDVSLKRVGDAIGAAGSSVLYAVMQFGTGSVTQALAKLPNRDDIFSMGVIDQKSDAVVYSPSAPNGRVIPYDYLHGQVPPPFHEEFGKDADPDPNAGRIIHDKFVVVDFNGDNPQVFFGSSNLAAGGEHDNGDSLVACKDPLVVSSFAVEAMRNIDHFHFRSARHAATDAKPLMLHTGDWWAPYYDPTNLKCRDRELFARS